MPHLPASPRGPMLHRCPECGRRVLAMPEPAEVEGELATPRWSLLPHHPARRARGFSCAGTGVVFEGVQRAAALPDQAELFAASRRAS